MISIYVFLPFAPTFACHLSILFARDTEKRQLKTQADQRKMPASNESVAWRSVYQTANANS